MFLVLFAFTFVLLVFFCFFNFQRLLRNRNDPDCHVDYGIFCLMIDDFQKVSQNILSYSEWTLVVIYYVYIIDAKNFVIPIPILKFTLCVVWNIFTVNFLMILDNICIKKLSTLNNIFFFLQAEQCFKDGVSFNQEHFNGLINSNLFFITYLSKWKQTFILPSCFLVMHVLVFQWSMF